MAPHTFDISYSIWHTSARFKIALHNRIIDQGKLSVRVGHKTIGPRGINRGQPVANKPDKVKTDLCAYSTLVE